MGQKTNVLTLRKLKPQLNLISENSKSFLYGFNFLKNFEKLLSRKGILVLDKTLNLENNKIFFTLTTFFRSQKTINYRRKRLIKKKPNNFSLNLETPFLHLFSRQFKLFSNSFLAVNFKSINKFLNKKLASHFYENIKRFNGILFSRRFNLFIDFIKFSSFFVQSKINSSLYLFMLGQIFRVLPKRKHTRFIFFLKNLFKFIVEKAPNFLDKQNIKTTKIKGIKFVINGKLQGKTRADSTSIQIGSVPIQSIGKNVDFSRLHVYTLYGAFGFQMWVYRN